MSASNSVLLEEPSVQISWGITQAELRALFAAAGAEAGLRCVTDGYYVARARALCGLATQIGFHFRPQAAEGVLAELEFFDNGQRQLAASYELYQKHLELAFGHPRRSRKGVYETELRSHEWQKGRIRITHYVTDRFGPEEHVRIARQTWLESLLT